MMAAALGTVGCTASAPDDSDAADGPPVAELECDEGELPLTQRLSSGVGWALCWSVDPNLGLVLSDVTIAPPDSEPISVIDTLSISQLEVPYDDGGRLTSDITSAGFGGQKMQTLDENACLGDKMEIPIPNIGDGTHGDTPTREVLCTETIDGGLSYHSSSDLSPAVERRTDWRLSTVSRVGWYEYVSEYIFGTDGSIQVRLGATGDLSPVDYSEDGEHGWPVGPEDTDHATSHSHNAVWRIHWALGGDDPMQVEQYDAEPTGEMGTKSPILSGKLTQLEHPSTAEWVDRRWWRVLAPGVRNADEHPISYEIDLGKSDSFTFVDDHHHGAEAGYDVAFTNADECEVYATSNSGNCGDGVLDFVADGADQKLEDVVSWVAVGFHHVARDEDQSPMELHWQGFTLLPRDLSGQRFDVPEGREDVNGIPDNEWTEDAELYE